VDAVIAEMLKEYTKYFGITICQQRPVLALVSELHDYSIDCGYANLAAVMRWSLDIDVCVGPNCYLLEQFPWQYARYMGAQKYDSPFDAALTKTLHPKLFTRLLKYKEPEVCDSSMYKAYATVEAALLSLGDAILLLKYKQVPKKGKK
jgi:hypothetical protein